MTARWYCINTEPKKEVVVYNELHDRGFESYLPLEERVVTRAKQPWRNGTRRLPFFPSYLFVRFDVAVDDWKPIATGRGVKRIFSFEPDRPMPLPDGAIERLMLDLVNPEPSQLLPVPLDARVKITDGGNFNDFIGICKWSSEQRVSALLNFFGRETRVNLRRDAVVIVE